MRKKISFFVCCPYVVFYLLLGILLLRFIYDEKRYILKSFSFVCILSVFW